MHKLAIVVRETYTRQVKSWSFLFLVLSPFFFLGLSVGIGYLTASSFDLSTELVVVTTEETVKDTFSKDYQVVASEEEVKKKDDSPAYLVVERVDGTLSALYQGKKNLSTDDKEKLQKLLDDTQKDYNIKDANLTGEQEVALYRQAVLAEQIDADSSDSDLKNMVPFLSSFVLYFVIIIYASITGQEIATEKGTKIMEMLLSSIPANLYFYGRMLGIFLVLLTQVSIYLIGGLLCYLILPQIDRFAEFASGLNTLVDAVMGELSISIVIYLVMGTMLAIVLSGLSGVLVVRAEDASKSVQMLTYLTVAGLVMTISLSNIGEDVFLLKLLSYVPFFSSFTMPIRQINGFAGNWEIALSLLILFVSTIGLTIFIGNSYAGLVLQSEDVNMWQSFKKGLSRR